MIAATILWAQGAFAGALQTVTLDVKNMYCDLCPVTNTSFTPTTLI